MQPRHLQPRHRYLGPLLAGLAGIAILGLAFVPAWLDHYRILLGEGPRRINVMFSAWQSLAMPALGVGVVLVALGGLVSVGSLWWRRAEASRWPAPGWAALPILLGLALLVGAVPPIAQQGHATGVTVTAGWVLAAGIGLAFLALAANLASAPPSRRMLAVGAGILVLVGAGTWGGRQLQLNLVEGTGLNWSEGSYTRPASAGQPAETLTLRGGRYTVGDRWSGTYDPSGRVMSLTGDPACPNARGSYHVDAAPGGGITWERIVDTCAGGARATDLTTGVWQRDH